MDPIEIKIITVARSEEVKALYIQAGWWNDEDNMDPTWIERMIAGSYCFAAAFHGPRMIGMGRAISDGASDAYIQDITVFTAYRRRGIGKRICALLVQELKRRGIRWIGLIAEPGTAAFYRELGFLPLEDYQPMLLH
jgi:ribosomal protein S18 acetylase RimI-like enzyme